MNKKTYLLILFCILAGGAALAPFSSAQSQTAAQTVKTARTVRVVKPQTSDGYRRRGTYTGVIESTRTSELSFPRSGRLEKVLVDEGVEVQKGQVLALLDTRALQARRDQLSAQRARAEARYAELQRGARSEPKRGAQAQVRRLEADLRLAETKLQRRRALYEEGAIALEGLDDSTLRVEMLRENLETARQESLELHNGTRPEVLQQAAADIREIDASIQALQVDLQDCELRAPFAGSIAKRLKDEGTILSAGGPVLTLDEKGPKEAVIDLAASQEPPLTAKRQRSCRWPPVGPTDPNRPVQLYPPSSILCDPRSAWTARSPGVGRVCQRTGILAPPQ